LPFLTKFKKYGIISSVVFNFINLILHFDKFNFFKKHKFLIQNPKNKTKFIYSFYLSVLNKIIKKMSSIYFLHDGRSLDVSKDSKDDYLDHENNETQCFCRKNFNQMSKNKDVSQMEVFDRDTSDIFLFEKLGHGGSGRVKKGFSRTIGDFLALKYFKNEEFESHIKFEDILLSTIEECRQKNPKISEFFLAYHGLYKEKCSDSLIMIMQNGMVSFDKILKSGKVYKMQELIYVLRKLVRGFAILQENGIVNRDVKPENIILVQESDQQFSYKIADFGIGFLLSGDCSYLETQTIKGFTKDYAAPEVLKIRLGENDTGVYNPYKADVYSLGILVLKMINYRWGKKEVDMGMISDKNAFEKEYHSFLPILEKMLNEEAKERFDFKELDRVLNGNQFAELSIFPKEEFKFLNKYMNIFEEKKEKNVDKLWKLYFASIKISSKLFLNIGTINLAKTNLKKSFELLKKIKRSGEDISEETKIRLKYEKIQISCFFFMMILFQTKFSKANQRFEKIKQSYQKFILKYKTTEKGKCEVLDDVFYKMSAFIELVNKMKTNVSKEKLIPANDGASTKLNQLKQSVILTMKEQENDQNVSFGHFVLYYVYKKKNHNLSRKHLKKAMNIWINLFGKSHYISIIFLAEVKEEFGKNKTQKSLEFSKLIGPSYNVLNNKKEILEQKGALFELKNLPDCSEDSFHFGEIYYDFARFHLNEPLKVKKLFQKSRNVFLHIISEKPNIIYFILFCNGFLSYLNAFMGKNAEAIKLHYNTMNILFKLQENKTKYAKFLVFYGWFYLMMNKIEKAEKLIKRGLNISQKINGKTNINSIFMKITLGLLYYKKGFFQKALKILQQAVDFCDVNVESSHLKDSCYEQMSYIYRELGDNKKAKQILKKIQKSNGDFIWDALPKFSNFIHKIKYQF